MLKCVVQVGQGQNWPSCAGWWKAAAPGLPPLGVQPAAGALMRTALLPPVLCDSSAVTLLLRVAEDTLECCLHSLCLKKTAVSKYYVLYSPFNLSVCKAYQGETNHSSLKGAYPHGSCGAAWYGEAELLFPSQVSFLTGFYTHILSVLVGFFCHEAGQIRTRLLSKVVSSPSLEILRTWLDMTLSNLLCLDLLW